MFHTSKILISFLVCFLFIATASADPKAGHGSVVHAEKTKDVSPSELIPMFCQGHGALALRGLAESWGKSNFNRGVSKWQTPTEVLTTWGGGVSEADFSSLKKLRISQVAFFENNQDKSGRVMVFVKDQKGKIIEMDYFPKNRIKIKNPGCAKDVYFYGAAENRGSGIFKKVDGAFVDQSHGASSQTMAKKSPKKKRSLLGRLFAGDDEDGPIRTCTCKITPKLALGSSIASVTCSSSSSKCGCSIEGMLAGRQKLVATCGSNFDKKHIPGQVDPKTDLIVKSVK